MAGVQIVFTASGFEKPIAAFGRLALGDFSDMMKEIAMLLYAQTMRHFDGKYGPDGAWAELSAATQAGVMGRGPRAAGTQLTDTGQLRGSYDFDADALTARCGSNYIVAAYHQGGCSSRTGPNHCFSGYPARKQVGFADGEEDEVRVLVDTYLSNLLSG